MHRASLQNRHGPSNHKIFFGSGKSPQVLISLVFFITKYIENFLLNSLRTLLASCFENAIFYTRNVFMLLVVDCKSA